MNIEAYDLDFLRELVRELQKENRSLRACLISRRVRISERIFRQSRSEAAGILCGFQG